MNVRFGPFVGTIALVSLLSSLAGGRDEGYLQGPEVTEIGPVSVGDTVEEEIVLTNTSGNVIEVTRVAASHPMAAIEVLPFSGRVPRGGSAGVRIRVTGRDGGDFARLAIDRWHRKDLVVQYRIAGRTERLEVPLKIDVAPPIRVIVGKQPVYEQIAMLAVGDLVRKIILVSGKAGQGFAVLDVEVDPPILEPRIRRLGAHERLEFQDCPQFEIALHLSDLPLPGRIDVEVSIRTDHPEAEVLDVRRLDVTSKQTLQISPDGRLRCSSKADAFGPCRKITISDLREPWDLADISVEFDDEAYEATLDVSENGRSAEIRVDIKDKSTPQPRSTMIIHTSDQLYPRVKVFVDYE